MREQAYCAGAMESQIRLVADFSRWMMKTQIAVGPQKREAQGNLVRLVRKGAVLEIEPA